ncbi:MAG TPA: stress response translation initiation inhibitor YciH [Ktedonobacterales bacterium]|nr:stress response translation initiation inhibitor YciH [Ktedonobacterales bacterium]
MSDSRGDRPVYVTGIGRIKLCKRCGQPEDQCRCGREPRAGEIRPGVPRDGVVRVMLDRKGRGGKAVTLVMGVPGAPDEIAGLGKSLKQFCGAGGAVKDDVIEVQGDHRDRIIARLTALGYKVKRVGG